MVDVARTRRTPSGPRSGPAPIDDSIGSYARGAIDRVKQYARDEPVSFGLWAFGVGFLIGWKLKP